MSGGNPLYRQLRGSLAAFALVIALCGCAWAGPAGAAQTESAAGFRETSVSPVVTPARGGALPSSYDGRRHGKTTPVKDQGALGTCWAFASLTALESRLLPDEQWDFSEDHMSHNPNFLLKDADGGEYTMAMAYLLSWQGPVREEDDPYGDGVSPQDLSPVRHVQEIRILPAADIEAVKRAVYDYGSVEGSLYIDMRYGNEWSVYYNADTYAYCCTEQREPDHDVVIVGWNDHFPKEAFSQPVSSDGAFICQNSWGESFGEAGYFYVSYEDRNISAENIVYSGVESPDNYTEIYQSDLCGWIGQLGYGAETAWGANVYTAEKNTVLQAVGFYAIGRGSDYEVYAVEQLPENPSDRDFAERTELASGHLQYAGYYTVPFRRPVELLAGERFAVMVRMKTPGAVHPIAIEYDAGDGKCRIDLTDGEGYASPDGDLWERVEEDQNCNLCLKAYGTAR